MFTIVNNIKRFDSEIIKRRRFLLAFIGGLLLTFSAYAQDFPKEIRGYKVYKTKISVRNQSAATGNPESAEASESEAFVKIGEPQLVDVSLTGITFSLTAEFNASKQSGKVDFLTFQDFRVNDLAVEIEEYRQSFEFEKNQKFVFSKPFKVFVGAGQTLRGALSEWNDSKPEWTVTGRVFVFGRFKKAGFKFKRVVPIEINLRIANPLPKI